MAIYSGTYSTKLVSKQSSTVQEKVELFDEETSTLPQRILEAIFAKKIRRINSTSSIAITLPDLKELTTEAITEIVNTFSDDSLDDYLLTSMPKSVTKIDVKVEFMGKGKPRLHFDFEVD